MRSLFLAPLLVTMASAAAVFQAQDPKIEVSYTDGKTTQKVMYEYGSCMSGALPDGKHASYFHSKVKAQCEYFFDNACTQAARPPVIRQPGNYPVDNVEEYGKCIIAPP